MQRRRSTEIYTPRELALAAGVPEARVLEALGGRPRYLTHADAVILGRRLARSAIFSIFEAAPSRRIPPLPLVLSSTLHAGVAAVLVLLALGPTPEAVTLPERPPAEPTRLVFLNVRGPGGGGGGGGRLQKAAPPKARREGQKLQSSPVISKKPEPPLAPIPKPPEPAPPLEAEPLPVVTAPIATVPSDTRNSAGVLEDVRTEPESRGPGARGGAGTGQGTGIGQGDGAGVGPGSGGGTGGGPFRPGAGISPPRLLREVKADYTEEARRRGITGEVILEIVVRRDGAVGDLKVLRGLGGGLSDRAIEAVRQWRFSPATRQGAAIDVVVEVAVEFLVR